MATTIVDGVERFFDGMGLMTGEYAVPKRMVVGGLIGAFLVTYFKPSVMFEAGRPRPWSIMSDANTMDSPAPTSIPWWVAPAAGAFIGGVLI